MFFLNDLVSFKSHPGMYRISKIGDEIDVITKIYNKDSTKIKKKIYYLQDVMLRGKQMHYSAFDNEIVLIKSNVSLPFPIKKKMVKKKKSLKKDAEVFLNFFKCINF